MEIIEKVNKALWVIIKEFFDGTTITDKNKRVLIVNLNMYMDVVMEKYVGIPDEFSSSFTFKVKDYGRGILGVQCIDLLSGLTVDTDDILKDTIGGE